MTNPTIRRARGRLFIEGLAYGVVAGAVFLIAQMVVSVSAGEAATAPLRFTASVVLREDGLVVASPLLFVLGLVVHFALSALFGGVYAFVVAAIARDQIWSYPWQTPLGVLFGLSLWLVNFHVIARNLYPWFLDTPQLVQAVLHALCFGLPLSALIAERERRRRGHARVPAAA